MQRISLGQASDHGEPFWINPASKPAKPDALRSGSCETGSGSFLNPGPLKLGQCCEDVKLQLPGWCCAVDALAQADKGHPDALKFLKQGDEVTEIPTQPV